MGFFRCYKLSDYTADECRAEMDQLLWRVFNNSDHDGENTSAEGVERLMEEWACFRELLARHEGKNKSQLDS